MPILQSKGDAPDSRSRWTLFSRAWTWKRLSPPRVFVGSFLLLMLLGTVGLKVLPGLYTGEPLGWIDALFTSTSAVCVTGLIVVDTATYFTLRGQLFILLLIQIGGLGMITFTSLIIVALGRRLSLRQESLSTSNAEVAPHVQPARLLRDIVGFTFLLELIGAIALFCVWFHDFDDWRVTAWHAVFHSVSAFCNAGFSTFSDSLISAQTSPAVLSVIMFLIVLGGIGFLTLEELYLFQKAKRKGQRFRLSLHSRLVLTTTAVLLVVGWIGYFLLDRNGVFKHLGTGDTLVNTLFMSVTARTAGFNNIDYGQASVGSNFFTILLMSVGGSPGSTAGGLKTTTVALIFLVAWSRLRGQQTVTVAGRSVPEETIQRAIGLFVIVFGIVTAGILSLAVVETQAGRTPDFLRYMFEAVSAFNTVGLSMGATYELTEVSRVTTVLLMFAGRVGPLAIAAALTVRNDRSGKFRYAYEDVVVG